MINILKTFLILIIVAAIAYVISPSSFHSITSKIKDHASTIEEVPSRIISSEQGQNFLKPIIKFEQSVLSSRAVLKSEEVVTFSNKERQKEGLKPLTINTKLNASAKLKVEDMIRQQYFEHDSPQGKGVSDLGNEVKYDYITMGENLALGNFTSSEDLVIAWMNSPGHRANIMNPKYTEIGVSVIKGTYQGREVWFAVQHFGTPKTLCPSIDTSLKNKIVASNALLKEEERELYAKRVELDNANYPSQQEYEQAVKEFNALVAKYNAAQADAAKKVALYNAQVAAFNKCLLKYQTSEHK
jgi:uncharacterized protein YkwD